MNVQLIESLIEHLKFEEIDSFSKLIIVFEKEENKGSHAKFDCRLFFQSAFIWPISTHFEKKIQSALTWSQI